MFLPKVVKSYLILFEKSYLIAHTYTAPIFLNVSKYGAQHQLMIIYLIKLIATLQMQLEFYSLDRKKIEIETFK